MIRSILVCILSLLLQYSMSYVPQFRILAPPFLCPRENDETVVMPDYTVITLQSESFVDVTFKWTVRWAPLSAPTQRFTLALWKTVRALEKQLNRPQSEPGVYIINDSELLSGVNYIFNVTASSPDATEVVEKSFHIDNKQGDQKLFVEGRSDMFSIVVIGAQSVYADQVYMLEAQVTTCYKTHDYYFIWTVSSKQNEVNISQTKGAKLDIKAGNLMPGLSYNVLCKVYKFSNQEYITENGLTFRVKHRDININFNFDVLVIPVGTPFSISTDIDKIDYMPSELSVSWDCTLKDKSFNSFESYEDGSLFFPSGLPDVADYYVTVTIFVLNNIVASNSTACIKTVKGPLPIIEVQRTTPRIINENSLVILQANVSYLVPGCSVTWYFNDDYCLLTTNKTNETICGVNEHGVPISDPINFYSLEENFLSELTDYSNETTWKFVAAEMQAAEGTAKIVSYCDCGTIINCNSEGTVYADIKLTINKEPGAGEVLIIPGTGTAMETIFRISTLGLQVPNRPLRYTFFCGLGNNEPLMLEDYLEYLAIETLLPYVDADNGTSVWVQVCDSLGACSTGTPTFIKLAPGEARTLEQLIADMKAFIKRCELILLRRLVASALVTYKNAGQTDAHIKFTSILLDTLKSIDNDCIDTYYEEYNAFLYWLSNIGIETL